MRDIFLCALVLAIGVSRPVAAQGVESVGVVSSRVESNDRISVRKANGDEVVGRFLDASDASLALEANGQMTTIPASDIRQVTRRRSRLKQGMLLGFLTGAGFAIAATTGSRSSSEWSTGDKIFVGTLAGGGAGLVWGAVIGAVLRERTVVYSADGRRR